MKHRSLLNKHGLTIIEIAVSVITLIMLFFPIPMGESVLFGDVTQRYIPGTVTAIVSEDLYDSAFAKGRLIGEQRLEVRLYDGRDVKVTNFVTDTYNVIAKQGSSLIICADEPGGDIEPYYTVYSHNRIFAFVLIVAVFFLLMVLVGRRKGADSFLAILFTLVFILNVSLPLLYRGNSAVLVGLVTVLVSTAVTILLIHGFSSECVHAVVTTLMGELAALIIFSVFARIFNVSGFQTDDAETLLLVTRRTGLDVYHLLMAGMMISSLGAVMDVAVSMLSSLREVGSAMMEPSRSALFRSGMSIGKDMIGTMANTLIFAFVGGSLSAMLVFYSYGVQPWQLLNSNYLALELSQGLCSTMAVILTVPFAALVGSAVFSGKKS